MISIIASIASSQIKLKRKMKLTATLILSAAFSASAWVSPKLSNSRLSTSLDAASIWYSTSTGNTETIAGYIADASGAAANDIGDATTDEITGSDALIVGAPTWHTGADEQRSGTSWDDWLYDTLPNLELEGKKVAIFGCGDQESYSDYYCDAAGELYDKFADKGCNHEDSKAQRDGKFIGLMCDEDNQYDLSEDRAKAWVAQLKDEGFF